MNNLKKKFIPVLFVGPFLSFLLVFRIAPIGINFYMSFCKWDIMSKPKFIGLQNYTHILFDDPFFLKSLINTFYYVILSLPLLMSVGLILAFLFNRPVKGREVSRVLCFLPYVIMVSAVATVWRWLYETHFGLINYYLRSLGLEKVPWIAAPSMAMISVVLVVLWWRVGYNMTIFLAGLQEIPKTLYESAQLDGANTFQSFWFITLPLLRPTIFFVFVWGGITSFQVFDVVFTLTQGGPVNSTITLVHYMYLKGFSWYQFGGAATVGCVLFFIIFVFVLIQFKTMRQTYV